MATRKATRKVGMGANPLAGDAAGVDSPAPARGGLLHAVHSVASTSDEVTTVRVADLSPNPDNPDARATPSRDLVDSVRQVGIIMPLAIMSAKVFLAEKPEHAEAVGAAPWVVLAGHQRRGAALEVGLGEVPVAVRDDLRDRIDEIMLAENLHRLALTPLQEARQYQRIMDRHKLSQRKLAEHVAVSQAKISKRLRLLTLPEATHPYIESGDLGSDLGVDLADELKDDELAVELFVDDIANREKGGLLLAWTDMVREAKRRAAARRILEEAEAKAKEEDIKLLRDPSSHFKGMPWNNELTSEAAIEKSRKAGDLAIGPSQHGVRYYTTAKPKKTTPRVVSEWEQKQQVEKQSRKEAAARRREHLAGILQKRTLAKIAAPMLTRAMTAGAGLGSNVTTLARKLATAAEIGPTEQTEDWAWRSAAELHEDQGRLAAVVALAALEICTGDEHLIWGAPQVAYLEWLQEQGYTPTDWELAKFTKGTKDVAVRAKQMTDYAESPANADEEN